MELLNHRKLVRRRQREKEPDMYDCQLEIQNKDQYPMYMNLVKVILKENGGVIMKFPIKGDDTTNEDFFTPLQSNESFKADFVVQSSRDPSFTIILDAYHVPPGGEPEDIDTRRRRSKQEGRMALMQMIIGQKRCCSLSKRTDHPSCVFCGRSVTRVLSSMDPVDLEVSDEQMEEMKELVFYNRCCLMTETLSEMYCNVCGKSISSV